MNDELNAICYLDCADVFLQEEPRWEDEDDRQTDPDEDTGWQ
jgi:hypothetical protein|tara:strand:+ start:323 stop:448 length:126 start_codon:yes stop_codon:yes gene_type:complete